MGTRDETQKARIRRCGFQSVPQNHPFLDTGSFEPGLDRQDDRRHPLEIGGCRVALGSAQQRGGPQSLDSLAAFVRWNPMMIFMPPAPLAPSPL